VAQSRSISDSGLRTDIVPKDNENIRLCSRECAKGTAKQGKHNEAKAASH